METAALARISERHRIPWSVFRAISDRASDGSLDEEVFQMSNQDGTFNARSVASFFVGTPVGFLQWRGWQRAPSWQPIVPPRQQSKQSLGSNTPVSAEREQPKGVTS